MEIYYGDNAGSCISRQVTLNEGSCDFNSNTPLWNGGYRIDYYQTMTFSLDSISPVPITLSWRIYYIGDSDIGGHYEEWQYNTITIPAGQLSKDYSFYCFVHTYEDFGSGGMAHEENRLETPELLPQPVIPAVCLYNPPSCTLAITGNSLTYPVNRGDATGSVTVFLSGATGTTVNYKLNGAASTGDVTGKTFSGLVAGGYTVVAQQDLCIVQQTYEIPDGEFRTGSFVITGDGGTDVTGDTVQLVAVDNPIIIRVATAINSAQPKQSITEIIQNYNLVDGDSITFNLTSPFAYTNTFYSKYFPNKTNYFLAAVLKNKQGVTVGSNTHTEVATSLAEALQNDAVIPKVYNINQYGEVITLTAKETGTKFNLDSTNVVVNTAALTISQTQVGVDYCDGQITDNYSISCEVMANTDYTNQFPDDGDLTDFNRIAELVLPFNPDNIHTFDISGILKSQVTTPKPDMTLTGSTLLSGVMQPYFCKLYELYPLVANTNTIKKRYKSSTNVKWVIDSSLDRYVANNMNNYLGQATQRFYNLNPNFTLYFDIPNATMEFRNTMIDYSYVGTTGLEFSIWNESGTTKLYGWKNDPEFYGLPLVSGNFLARLSANTDGYIELYERVFYFNSYGSGYDTTIQSPPTSGVWFLTNSPNPKQIQRNSSEFLYFVLGKDYGKTLKVKGDLYFYDGTSATGQTFFTISTGSTNSGGVMCLNLSYDKLGLAAYEVSGTTNRKIKRADIAVYQEDIYNGDVLYTDVKSYRFEIDEMPRKYGILFQNSLGMYDAFDFVGVVETTVNRTAGTYTVPLIYNSDGSILEGTKNTSTYDTKIIKKIIVNTGWLNKTHFDWLKEMIKSNNIYSTETINQNYLNLMEFDYVKSSLDDLYSCEFTFLYTIYDNGVTV
jgi:hypothetical protein